MTGAARLDWNRWERYRSALDKQTLSVTRDAAALAAAHLREMHGRLPVQTVIEEMAEYLSADVGEVLAYLCGLGAGLLIAETRPQGDA